MGIDTTIKRLFVVMMENRSFDNLLGWSDLSGTTPDGASTSADTLMGKPVFTNRSVDPYTNQTISHPIAGIAPYRLCFDPGHEFADVLLQLCHDKLGGIDIDCTSDTVSLPGGEYPPMVSDPNDLGYAECLQRHGVDVDKAFTCFKPDQLPVIHFLARQFAVCDRWFSSMPGPTLPNRFFALAGQSWGIDHSPDSLQVVSASFFNNKFGDGQSLFSSLSPNEWLVVYGDTPVSWSIKGTANHIDRFMHQSDFFTSMEIGGIDEDVRFVFIEPHYSPLDGFAGGESMHPKGDVRNGEAFIRDVYESFRQSRYWQDSALLITFDEHGGFFDHVIPDDTNAFPPLAPTGAGQKHGFRFDRYGVRVPAIIVSPYVRAGTIDHTVYDHLSIAKTLQEIARPDGGPGLLNSARFETAASFSKVFTLAQARTMDSIPDCPAAVPLDDAAATRSGATAEILKAMTGPDAVQGGALR